MFTSRLTRTTVLSLAALLLVAGCSDTEPEPETSATETLQKAGQELATSSGARLVLSSQDFPTGTSGIVGAEGVSNATPAFDGTLTVRIASTDFQVPVVAVDDTVWAQIPLTKGWSDIDPADYGAPDPSGLLGEEAGVGALLKATEEIESGEAERGGKNNDEILTTYTGTIPGQVMRKVIPSSAGDTFDVAYRIGEDGRLSSVDMTGIFYDGTKKMTYTLDVTDYGLDQTITAP